MYWPTTVFLRSPYLTWETKQELLAVSQPGTVLSTSTMVACHQIAEQTPSNGKNLVLICSEGTPSRRAYLQRPDADEWEALERGGFVASHIGFGFSLDALH